MGYPKECSICVEKGINAELFQGNLELSVKAFQRGQKPTVMLVGLNPTLTKKQAHTVFELDNEDSAIYKYISHDILRRTGLKLDEIYATNLVKCTFPSNQEPRSLCQKVFGRKDNETIKRFLLPFFGECKKYFRSEIREINPKIVISFGEVPHQLIVKEFDLQSQKVDKDMKKAFSNIYRVNILDRDFFYLPCIRLIAKPQPYFRDRWDVFIRKLQDAVISVGICIKDECP